MSNDELDFEWTAKDVDQAFLNAGLGNVSLGKKPKTERPNFLEMLKTGGELGKLNTRKEE